MPIQAIVNNTSETIINCAVSAGLGYLCARVFTVINPVHAAVACAISVLVSKVTNPLFDTIFCGPGSNNASKFIGSVLNVTISVVASIGVATALGFPITLPSFLCLNAIIIGSVVAATFSALAITAAGLMLHDALSR